MKRFITIFIVASLVVGLFLIILPVQWFPAFYDVRYMGSAALIGAGLVYFLPGLIRVGPDALNASRKNKASDYFQFLLAFALAGNGLGDLGLYELYRVGIQFDKILHFFVPLIGAIFLTQIIQWRFGMGGTKATIIAFFVILLAGVVWEVGEFLSDYFLKTHLDGVFGSDISGDTKFDLIFDVIGATLGTIINLAKPLKSRRYAE